MGYLRTLLAVDHRQVLEFFAVGLRDVCEPRVERDELLYNASVLAHYAQVSTHDAHELPAPGTLGDVFDHFVANPVPLDEETIEAAGAQCLLMAGFFAEQMRQRHSIRWYAELGSAFFNRASARTASRSKAQLLATLARQFEPWRRRHALLSRDLKDRAYVIAAPTLRPPEWAEDPSADAGPSS